GLPLRHRSRQGNRSHLEKRKLGRRLQRMGPPRQEYSEPPASAGGVQRASRVNMLLDSFSRVHNNLRISVTDRCNLRCTYCMPEEVTFMDRADLLTFEEITHFVRVAAPLGIDKLRLTGGEPLMRRDLHRLVAMLAAVPGIKDIGLTTN